MKKFPLQGAMFGRGRTGRRPAGRMNKLEEAFETTLGQWKSSGEILWFRYEFLTFTLAHGGNGRKGLRYTPDFAAMRPCGEIVFYEIKGFRDEKNIAKLKMAAELSPFRFFLVQWKGGKWVMEEY